MVHALSHGHAAKSPLVTLELPKFTFKLLFSCELIHKPIYMPHPWAHPTFHAKPHPYPISHFATMHWTDTHTHTNRWLEGTFDNYRLLTLYREQSVYCSYIFLYFCKAPITSCFFAHFLYFPVFFVIVADGNAKLCAALLAKDLQMASVAQAVFEASRKV